MQLLTPRLALTRLQPEDWQIFKAVHEDPGTMTWVSEIPDENDIRQRFTERLALASHQLPHAVPGGTPARNQ